MPIDVHSSLIRNSLNGTEPTWASAGAQAHAPRPLPTMEPHSASWRDGALLQRGGLGACAESEPVPEAAHLPYDPPSATEDEFRVARHSGSWGRGREWHRRGYRRGTPETRVETGPSRTWTPQPAGDESVQHGTHTGQRAGTSSPRKASLRVLMVACDSTIIAIKKSN